MVITNILFNFYLWNTFVHALICLVAWQRLLFQPFRLGCLTSKSNRLASRSDFFLLFKPLKSLKDKMLCQNLACPSLSKPVLVLHLRTGTYLTRNQVNSYRANSYPGQLVPPNSPLSHLVPMSSHTHINSYPGHLAPTSTRSRDHPDPGQLVLYTHMHVR